MPTLRDFIGKRCPVCRKDILQRPPEVNRLPIRDRLSCPTCHSEFSLETLLSAFAPRTLLDRLFSRSPVHLEG